MKAKQYWSRAGRWGLFISLLGTAFAARATLITYDVKNIGGDTWEYNYAVTNDTNAAIYEFALDFGIGQYRNLAATAAPSGWDPAVFPSDPGLPDNGFVDFLALYPDAAIESGQTLGGFAVSFDFLGDGTPGAQLFMILDPDFVLDPVSGTTRLATSPVPVPEPATLLLSLLGVVALLHRRRPIAA